MLCNNYTAGKRVRSAIVALRKEDPNISASEISRRVGRSRERIRQLLVSMDLPTKVSKSIILCEYCNGEIIAKTRTRRVFCSMQCYSDSRNTLIICDNCGDLFKRRITQLEYYTHVRGYEHYFCSRRCFGSWAGKNFGWHTPSGFSRSRKEDEVICERRNDILIALLHQNER